MMRLVGLSGLVYVAVLAGALHAQQPAAESGPRFVSATRLARPADYRSWPFLGTGLGLTYDGGGDGQTFTSTFVNPPSYRAFLETGAWPNGTAFVLEFRRAAVDTKVGKGGGRYQGELLALETEVKDSRFPDGWAFYTFGRAGALAESAEPLAGDAVRGCVECHTTHTAVERTFVQFYPELLEAARKHGTLKPGF